MSEHVSEESEQVDPVSGRDPVIAGSEGSAQTGQANEQSADVPAAAPAESPSGVTETDSADSGDREVDGNDSEPDNDQRSADAGTPASGGGYFTRRRARRAAKAGRPKRKAPWWELPALVLVAIGIAILVKSFVVQPFYIPSGSMEHTLHGCPGCSGDRILVNKVIYDFRDPEPGDIVVFNAPPGWDDESGTTPPGNPILRGVRGFGQLIGFVPPDGEVLVKRVIARGGQTVFGNAKGVYVCNTSCAMGSNLSSPPSSYRLLTEPYVFEDGADAKQDFGPVTVPKGRLWVMGDHRNNSADSRYHCGADAGETANDDDCDAVTSTVPDGDVIGKAFVIAWPPSRWTTLGTPATFDAGAPIVPSTIPVLTLVPLYFVRRRRRRRSSV